MAPKKKIIGFDLDDVLLAFNDALYPYHNRTYGTKYERKDITSYKLEEMWGCSTEEMLKRITDFYHSPAHLNVEPIQGAVEGIKKLAENHTLYIITSRSEALEEMTLQWLDTHFPGAFEKAYFTNHFYGNGVKRSKAEVCKELGIEIFIDDSLEHAHNISNEGIPVLLFDAPWNQAEVKDPITRVHSWDEVVEKLMV